MICYVTPLSLIMMIRSVNLKEFELKLKDLARVVGCKVMKTGRLTTWPTGKRQQRRCGNLGFEIFGLVKSDTASPTARHCCNDSSEFEAVLPKR